MARITLTFSREVTRIFDELGRGVSPVARRAMAEAVRVAVPIASALAIRDSGTLAANIASDARARRDAKAVFGFVKAKKSVVSVTRKGRSTATVADPAKYAHFVELGTMSHSLRTAVDMKAIRRGVTVFDQFTTDKRKSRRLARDYLYRRDRGRGEAVHPGASPHPFLQPAIDSNADAILKTCEREIIDEARRLFE